MRNQRDGLFCLMEYSPPRTEDSVHGQLRDHHKMSMIAMAQPTPHAAFKREFAWDESRHSEYAPSWKASDTELPSIRLAIPELQLRVLPQDTAARPHSSTTSPVGGYGSSSVTIPDYTHSPTQSKRRRLSIREEREERVSQVPRLYASPRREREYQRPGSRTMSPTLAHRSVTESWSSPSRSSPFMAHSALFPSIRESAPAENSERMVPRPTLPRLSNMEFDKGGATMPRIRGRSTEECYAEPSRHHPAMDSTAPSHYRSGSYFQFHHPSRVQSLSLGSVQMYDRTPFTPTGYGSYPDYMRGGEMGGIGLNGDNKQRKRRGNLPKETTDKLRAWFMAHLNHPYPTEDEKQKLMQQTGLQMNQISNWFINARRRQLPAMINNARAESDAMAGRNPDAKVLATTERDSAPLSDGEGSVFDDEIDNLKRRHTANLSRGSV